MSRLLYIFIGVVLSVFSVEGFLRLTKIWHIPNYGESAWYRSSDASLPHVPYQLKNDAIFNWGRGKIITNSVGIRDSHQFERKDDSYRILAIGDSITFGFGVDESETFPAALEQLLNEEFKGRKYEVINAGIPGYNINDMGALLPYLLERYRPDLIIWTLVPNDFDDSLGVSERGELNFTGTNYVVNADSLASWGHSNRNFIDSNDFRTVMSLQAIAWANEKALPRSQTKRIDEWLTAHSYVHSFIKARISKGALVAAQTPPPDLNPYILAYKGKSGRIHPTPPLAAVYSSEHATSKSVAAIEAAANLAKAAHIPLILLNTALPIELKEQQLSGLILYEELTTYIQEPFYTFLANNNLQWDGHFSPHGNKKIATAIKEMLLCRNFITGKKNCTAYEALNQEMKDYWSFFHQEKSTFIKKNYNAIIFEHFIGIHQILGGIFPPRIFPGHLAQRANVLLPDKGAKKIELEGYYATSKEMLLTVRVFRGSQIDQQSFTIHHGKVAISMNLRELPLSRSEPLEVELVCAEESCPQALRLTSIKTS